MRVGTLQCSKLTSKKTTDINFTITQKFHSLYQSSDLRQPPGKQLIMRVKGGKFFKFRTPEIASTSFSGTIQQTLVWQSPGLPVAKSAGPVSLPCPSTTESEL